jgi:hypothetical protein
MWSEERAKSEEKKTFSTISCAFAVGISRHTRPWESNRVRCFVLLRLRKSFLIVEARRTFLDSASTDDQAKKQSFVLTLGSFDTRVASRITRGCFRWGVVGQGCISVQLAASPCVSRPKFSSASSIATSGLDHFT